MESICYSLRQDLNSIQYLSEEIERLNFTVKDRDTELQQARKQFLDFNRLNESYS
jgi:hypothetical protein